MTMTNGAHATHIGRALPHARALVRTDDLISMPGKDMDSSLTMLVRQWVTTSEAVDRRALPVGDDSPLPPKWTPPKEDPLVSGGSLAPVATHSPKLAEVAPLAPGTGTSPDQLPALPRRRRQPVARPTRRLAVLIDAETTSAESADALFDVLGDEGTVSVCRAYADWTSPQARGWWTAPLQRHSIQPYHHFGRPEDQRALVALTIDAVDLARESAVEVVVIVGDLVSLHPLVARLNTSGLQVYAFGTTPTPRDVRDLCHEFVDLSGHTEIDADASGKHRA